MTHAYFEEGIECPECGHTTRELYNALDENGETVLLCEDCFYEDD